MISRNDSKMIPRVFFPMINMFFFVTLEVQKLQSGRGSAPDPHGPYPDIRAGPGGRRIQVSFTPPSPRNPGSVPAILYYIYQLIQKCMCIFIKKIRNYYMHVYAVYETNQLRMVENELYRKELCSNPENAPSSEDGGVPPACIYTRQGCMQGPTRFTLRQAH